MNKSFKRFTILRILSLLIISFLFLKCRKSDASLENALSKSGNNRKELENVLIHYAQHNLIVT